MCLIYCLKNDHTAIALTAHVPITYIFVTSAITKDKITPFSSLSQMQAFGESM